MKRRWSVDGMTGTVPLTKSGVNDVTYNYVEGSHGNAGLWVTTW